MTTRDWAKFHSGILKLARKRFKKYGISYGDISDFSLDIEKLTNEILAAENSGTNKQRPEQVSVDTTHA